MIRPIRPLLLALAASSAGLGTSASGATQTMAVKATVVKPLTLITLQGLNLGTITLLPGNWSGATVGISRTGTLSCTNTNTICSGAVQPAQLTVTGSNNQVVKVTAPNVTLVNQANSSKTLLLTLDVPPTVTLPNSGNKGVTFGIGGSIKLSSTTAQGTYSGTMNVTVNYQ